MIDSMSPQELAGQIRDGSIRALARGLSWVEARTAAGSALVDLVFPFTGRAHIVGMTGAPGAGKSTLTAALVKVARERGTTVGILAVDPSSPYSGGSILGDRIRMSELGSDPAVFIRSMATRGALGGLCTAAREAVDLMDAAGKDLIVVETVGVGQDEVDIMRLAHTTALVSVPGLGDEIQTMKAGIIEIANLHVVNKADRDGADRTAAELQSMLVMSPVNPGGWTPPIVSCIASTGRGVEAVFDQIQRHERYLRQTGGWLECEYRMAESRVLKLAQEIVASTLRPIDHNSGRASREVSRVADRSLSPRQCARALIEEATRERGTTHV
jgi:LAO/AO transport system kinase